MSSREPALGADVIVVGAGTAGCIVARRLLDAGLTVLLVEAGPDRSDAAMSLGATDWGATDWGAIDDPVRMHELWDSDVDWGYRTVPQEHAHGRELHLPRGRVVGGSHALNAMIWVRGHRADYDTWAYLGNTGWSWSDIEPVFRRMENRELEINAGYEPHPAHQAIVAAAVQHGIPFNPDYNGAGGPDGVSYAQFMVRGGQRLMTSQAYLDPVRADPGLRVVSLALVHRLILAGGRCVGVEWDRDGQLERASADHVVLAAGALGSPQLLQRSGIGDPAILGPLGVDVSVALRGVGRNLQDHWLVPVILATADPIPVPTGLPYAQSHLFWPSRPGHAVPDLQPIHFAAPLVAPWMTPPPHGISLMAGLVRPASRGTVQIASTDPRDPPLIDPRVLSAPTDLEALVAAVELCRGIAQEPALRDGLGARELYPGSLASTVESMRDYIRETVVTYHHQSGTCTMGWHDDAVVDPQLRVHGVPGLTVADASVMPLVTTGNTNAPTAMIGERAAAFLLRSLR